MTTSQTDGSARADYDIHNLRDEAEWGPHFGLYSTLLRLWRCYCLTGEDVSGGPFPGWDDAAVMEVKAMREREDELGGVLIELVRLLDLKPQPEAVATVVDRAREALNR